MTRRESDRQTAAQARRELRRLASPRRARINAGYFKSGPGEYGEGDRFIGVTVPLLRSTAQKFNGLRESETIKLLKSRIHEERLLALYILVQQFKRGEGRVQRRIYNLYLRHRGQINNWDLVDSSAEHIVGEFLRGRSRAPLYRLARSRRLWDRRIAVIATFSFIKCGEYGETLKLAELLLNDTKDLMHKAVGWMLREIGNRDFALQNRFLRRHHRKMPRTMLRYAIERYPERMRRAFLRQP